MKEICLRQYQAEAIDAIQKALDSGQKHMVVERPTGCGKSAILAR